MFEMDFSNPAFLGYVNECEEDYHRSKLDSVAEDLISLNLSIYDDSYCTRAVCASNSVDYDYLTNEDYEYIVKKLSEAGIY